MDEFNPDQVSYFLIRPHVDSTTVESIIKFLIDELHVFCCIKWVYMPTSIETIRRVQEEYEEHRGKPFHDDLITSMTIEWQYPHCVVLMKAWPDPHHPDPEQRPMWQRVREFCGPTNPAEASNMTIRGRFGKKNQPLRYNVVHSPDSRKAAIAFAKRWVPKDAP